MSILYYDNCSFTNVGQAFINIGAKQIINTIFPGEQIINVSRMNTYYIDKTISHIFDKTCPPQKIGKHLQMWNYVGEDAKCLVLSGLLVADLSLVENGDFMRNIRKRGIPIIFLGLGQAYYTKDETENFLRFLSEIEPFLIVSRDKAVYENFKNYFYTIDGIDSAFWCKDGYDPSSCSSVKKYDMVSYNRTPEPTDLQTVNEIVRAYHFQYGFRKKHIKDNLLISDSPYDYMTMYACCENVYTDLVHATIISLQYGKHVRFDRTDNRGLAVDALDELKKDEKGMLYIDSKDLENQKHKVIELVEGVVCKL